MASEIYLGANDSSIWALQHEADYNEGDTVIRVWLDENGDINVTIRPDQVEVCEHGVNREDVWCYHCGMDI